MHDFMTQFEAYAAQRGWRVSGEHKLVVREIFNLHTHFTEQDLAEHARLSGVPAKTRTLILERLVLAGLVRKMMFAGRHVYYEHVYGHVHHDHLICVHCGKIIEFRDENIEKRQKQVCKKHDFRMIKHSLHIMGECSLCQKQLQDKAAEIHSEQTGPWESRAAVPLSTIPNDRCVRLESIQGGKSLQKRLQEMGLVKGTVIRVVSNRFSGPFIIQVHQARLALGQQLTHRILVREEQCETS